MKMSVSYQMTSLRSQKMISFTPFNIVIIGFPAFPTATDPIPNSVLNNVSPKNNRKKIHYNLGIDHLLMV